MAGLGDLVIKLHADIAQFTSDMGRAAHVSEREWAKVQRSAASAATAIGVAVGIASAATAKLTKDLLDTADSLAKSSQKLGISVESLDALQHYANLSGVNVEQLSAGLRFLSKNAVDTAANTGDARLAFQALGISVVDAHGKLKPTEMLLEEVAEKFAGMEDGAGKTAIAMRIFGKSGAELIPLLNGGAEGFKRNREEAEKYGLITTDLAKKSERFNDSLTLLARQARGLALDIFPAVVDKLNKLVDEFNEGIRVAGGFWQALARFGTTNPFKTPQENIDELTGRIERARQAIEKINTATPGKRQGAVAAYQKQIEADEQRRKFEIYRRNQELSDSGYVGDTGMPTDSINPKKKAPGLPDEAAIKKAQEEAKKAADAIAKYSTEAYVQAAEEAMKASDDLIYTWDAQGNRVTMTMKEWEESLKKVEEAERIIAKVLNQEYVTAAEEAQQAADDLVYMWDEHGNRITKTKKELDDAEKKATDAAREYGFVFNSALEDAVVNGKSLRDVMGGLAQDLARLAFRKLVTEPLAEAVSNMFKLQNAAGSGGGGGGLFGGLLGSVVQWGVGALFGAPAIGDVNAGGLDGALGDAGPNSMASILGMADGGQFTVGGVGGIDSQNVLFKATPGELVTVSTPGQSSGGGTYYIDARGADTAGLARLEDMIRRINGSIEQRAVAAVVDTRRRGGPLAQAMGA